MIPVKREAEDLPDRLLYPVDEAVRLLGGITDRKLRSMATAGEITPTRIGSRVFYSKAEIERYIADQEAKSRGVVAA